MNKWTARLIGLPLLLAASAGAGFAWAGNGPDIPDGGYAEPREDQSPIQPHDGIDPGRTNGGCAHGHFG